MYNAIAELDVKVSCIFSCIILSKPKFSQRFVEHKNQNNQVK